MAKDQKYIDRLKGDIRDLKELNQQLRAQLQKCDGVVRKLIEDSVAAKKLFWAMAHSNGGRYKIPDGSMRLAEDAGNLLHSYHDDEACATVVEAKTEVQPTPPPKQPH